jgi:peptide/nickel transport system substrate-binding protein
MVRSHTDDEISSARTGSPVIRTVLALGLVTALGCSRRAVPESSGPPEPGGSLRIAVLDPLDSPSPLYGMGPTTAALADHIIPPLGRIDTSGTLRLLLASRFIDTGVTTDFVLKPIRWEDGVAVTPRDIVLTATLLRDPRTHSPDRRRTDLLRDCVVLDDSTVRFEWATIYSSRRRDGLLAPLPSHLPTWPAGGDTLRDRPHAATRLACGPYRLAFAASERFLMVRNDSSGFTPALLDTVDVVATDAATAVREFGAGRLDVIWDLPVHQVREVRRHRGTRSIALVGTSYVFIGWNLRDGRFAEPAVRRAAAMAVDVHRLIHDLTGDLGEPSRGPLTALAGFADTTAVLPHDPAAAKRALEDAGWRDTDGDGARERRGARLDFYILVSNQDSLRIEVARRVARDLARVGIVAHVRAVPISEMTPRLLAHDFEAFVGQWYPDAEAGLDPVWRSESTDRFNFGGYASARTDSLLTILSHELDPPDREVVLSRFQAQVYADQPVLFLFQNPHFLVLAPQVRGADPQVVSPFWNLPEWWVPSRLRPARPPMDRRPEIPHSPDD